MEVLLYCSRIDLIVGKLIGFSVSRFMHTFHSISLPVYVLILTCISFQSRAVDLDVEEVSMPYQLYLEDGDKVRVRIKSIPKDETANLILTTFETSDMKHKAYVAFEISEKDGVIHSTYMDIEKTPEMGIDVELAASNIRNDVSYKGELKVNYGNKFESFNIHMQRHTSTPPFQCPPMDIPINIEAGIGKTSLMRTIFTENNVDYDLELLKFVSNNNNRDVKIYFDDNKTQKTLPIGEKKDRIAITLKAQEIFNSDIFKGNLRITKKESGKGDSVQRMVTMFCELNLKKHDVELALNPNKVEKSIEKEISGTVSDNFIIGVSEVNGFRTGKLKIVPEGNPEGPDGYFVPENHYDACFVGKVEDDDCNVDENIKSVKFKLKDLSAGEYKFSLRFNADNSASSANQKVEVVLNVKHHWLWAFLAVFIALLMSYSISKGIINWRDRAVIRNRINKLKAGVPEKTSELPSNVWLRSLLEQCNRLMVNPQYFSNILPPVASINMNLENAEKYLKIVRARQKTEDMLDNSDFATNINDHYKYKIKNATKTLERETLDPQVYKKILDELTVIQDSLKDPYVKYWKELQGMGAELLAKIESIGKERLFGENDHDFETEVISLITTLKTQDNDKKREYDEAYWKLHTLALRYGIETDKKRLLTSIKKKEDLSKYFAIADNCMWERLEEAIENNKIKVKVHDGQNKNAKRQTLIPIQFALEYSDENRVLQNNYFINNSLKFKWTFSGDAIDDKVVTTQGPRVTRFATKEGSLKVEVEIEWKVGKNLLQVIPKGIELEKNYDIKLSSKFVFSEAMLMLFILLLTWVSGFMTLYSENATFGSLSNYLAIITWAVGIDQGKKSYPEF